MYAVQDPAGLHDVFAAVSHSTEPDVQVTLQLYTPLCEIDPGPPENPFGPRILNPLYDRWAKAIHDAPFPEPAPDHAQPTWHVVLDIARPSFPNNTATNFGQYEARGLLRITGLLRSKLRKRAIVEATVFGTPCWCRLAEAEKHVALPRGHSWPRSRTSHVTLGDARTTQGLVCLALAKEHWQDEHWADTPHHPVDENRLEALRLERD